MFSINVLRILNIQDLFYDYLNKKSPGCETEAILQARGGSPLTSVLMFFQM